MKTIKIKCVVTTTKNVTVTRQVEDYFTGLVFSKQSTPIPSRSQRAWVEAVEDEAASLPGKETVDVRIEPTWVLTEVSPGDES